MHLLCSNVDNLIGLVGAYSTGTYRDKNALANIANPDQTTLYELSGVAHHYLSSQFDSFPSAAVTGA